MAIVKSDKCFSIQNLSGGFWLDLAFLKRNIEKDTKHLKNYKKIF